MEGDWGSAQILSEFITYSLKTKAYSHREMAYPLKTMAYSLHKEA